MTEPGTQRPIEIFFPVSKAEQEPNVEEYTAEKLADLFAGTRQRGLSVEDEYAIFTDRTSADEFAKRQRLVYRAIGYIKRLSVIQLEEIVPALDPGSNQIEATIEAINHYCE